jgi:hypothetical protein
VNARYKLICCVEYLFHHLVLILLSCTFNALLDPLIDFESFLDELLMDKWEGQHAGFPTAVASEIMCLTMFNGSAE